MPSSLANADGLNDESGFEDDGLEFSSSSSKIDDDGSPPPRRCCCFKVVGPSRRFLLVVAFKVRKAGHNAELFGERGRFERRKWF